MRFTPSISPQLTGALNDLSFETSCCNSLVHRFELLAGKKVASSMLFGYFLGIVAASKAVVSEVTDDKNQAVGINIIGAAWGIGYILGPATAAAVADPIGQYSLNITSKPKNCFCLFYAAVGY